MATTPLIDLSLPPPLFFAQLEALPPAVNRFDVVANSLSSLINIAFDARTLRDPETKPCRADVWCARKSAGHLTDVSLYLPSEQQ